MTDTFSFDPGSLNPTSQASATSEYHSSDKSKRWLSYSQLANYLSCSWKWQARYVLRIQDTSVKRPMALGDAIHRGVASLLEGKSVKDGLEEWKRDMYSFIPEEMVYNADGVNIVDNIYDDAEDVLRRLVADLKTRGWQILVLPDGKRAVELELQTVLPGMEHRFDGFAAHLDAIIYDTREKVSFYVDWKTRGVLQNDASEEVNLQNACYQKVAMDNGIDLAGTITYQIKSKPAATPKLNKDGSMSRTRIASDWPTYKKALEDNGLNPSDYTDMIGKLDTDFIRPIKVYRSPEEVNNIWNNIIIPAALQIASDPFPVRSMNFFNCMNCDVRPVCLASLRGHDFMEFLRSSQYDPEQIDIALEKGYL